MTKQEIFDKAVAGLASQGFERSVINDDAHIDFCAYRGDGGRRCAIGWLIPDELYSSAFEGEPVRFLPPMIQEFVGYDTYPAFVEDLWAAHDNSTAPPDMRYRLWKIAERNNLTPSRAILPRMTTGSSTPTQWAGPEGATK